LSFLISSVFRSCSTPYGNQRKITSAGIQGSASCRSAQRLTAIRGKSRRMPVPLQNHIGRAQRLTAIRGKSPVTASAVPIDSGRAQRLTAIRGKSLPRHPVTCLDHAECSTPYGNQRKITRVTWVHLVFVRCAQRLTAIRGKSR